MRGALACLGPEAPASCAPDPDPACEPTLIDGVRFALCTTPMSWSDAEAVCQGRGGHLARLDDEAPARALSERAMARRAERWWIGLSDRVREGAPAWADGSAVGFTRWAKGQPDDAACGEDCAALKPRSGGAWSDGHCELRRPFLCR